MKRVASCVLALLLLLLTLPGAQDRDRSVLEAVLFEALDQGELPRSYLAGLLREPTTRGRALTVRVLSSTAQASNMPLLSAFMRDLRPEVQREVMMAAGRIGAPARGFSLTGVTSSNTEVRRAAVWAACHAGAHEAVFELLDKESDRRVLENALANLWRLDGSGWEERAARYARDADPILRRAAAYSLARGTAAESLPAVRELCRDSEPVIRATGLRGLEQRALGKLESALLVGALDDPDWRVAVAASRVLELHPEVSLEERAAERAAGLWRSPRPHLSMAAVRAAGQHSGIGEDETLARLATGAAPWLASEALQALARRGAAEAKEIAVGWTDGELWQRRAVAGVAHLWPRLEPTIAGDARAAVRLAWLEAMPAAGVASRSRRLWLLVAQDPDEAVRAQAVDALSAAGLVTSVDRLLSLYQQWQGDQMPDARAAALAAAMELPRARERVIELAASDRDPTVAALVAHKTGVEVARDPREARHARQWYLDLVHWARDEHWLDLVTTRGVIRLHLDTRAALTAREVWDLAERGFYDGLTFHRVVPNFVIQGGDPRGDGWGGPGFVLPDEPTHVPFDAWRVGIATSGPQTGGCQLFFTLLPEDRLTGHYTNVAEVVRGRDVVQRITIGDAIVRVETASGAEPGPPPPTLTGELRWSELAVVDGWQAEHDGYVADVAALDVLRSSAVTHHVLVILGTWCSDSQREVPRLQRVIDEVVGDRFELRLLGVDRSRRVEDHVELPDGVLTDRTAERVPTIIVSDAGGVELGRVVETAEAPLEQLLLQFIGQGEDR